MSIADRKVISGASGLLLLGFLAASIGHAAPDGSAAARSRGAVPDNRYNHGYYYPPRGGWVRALPPGYRPYYYRGRPYYFHDGVWFEPRAGGFFIIRPPVGLQVMNTYQVVGRPAGAEAPESPPLSDTTAGTSFVYPRNGQSPEQQATDRYECHTWSRGQTGFDPSEPGGDANSNEYASRSGEYRRAMNACLEGRGYSVR